MFKTIFFLTLSTFLISVNGFTQGYHESSQINDKGYFIDLKGDTISAVYKKGFKPCGITKVTFAITDESNQQTVATFTPQMIKGYGDGKNHYLSAGFYEKDNKLYIPNITEQNTKEIFAKVYYLGEHSLVAHHVLVQRTTVVPGPYGALPVATMACEEKAFLKGSGNQFNIITNFKRNLEIEAMHDPIILEYIKPQIRITVDEAADLFYRLDMHKKGVYLEDEKALLEKHKVLIETKKAENQVHDLLYSELKTLITSDGEILCRRTAHENTQTLMRFGQETYTHFKTVERYLQKGMKLYQSDSLTHEFKDYIPYIKKGIEYLNAKLSELNTSYYQNELMFYEAYLLERKD